MLKFRASKSHSIKSLLLVMLMVGALTFSFQPTTAPEVAEAAPGDVRITAIMDGTLTGGLPKVIELYVEGTVDLTGWQLWRSANGAAFANTGTTLTGTFTDEFVYLINDAAAFNSVFGSGGDFANRALTNSSSVSGNGNDGFQIRNGATIIDQVYEVNSTSIYEDSYMIRNDCTGPDGATWNFSDWTIPGNNVLDSFSSNPAGMGAAVPLGSWSCGVNYPVINEFNLSHSGTDDAEFVEIFHTPTTPLSNLTILQIEGDSGSTTGNIVSEDTVGTTDANGFWSTGYVTTDRFQNGTLTLVSVDHNLRDSG